MRRNRDERKAQIFNYIGNKGHRCKFGLVNAFESFACDIKLWVITACKDLWCNAIGKSTASTSGSKSSVEKKDTLLRSRKSLEKKKKSAQQKQTLTV